MAAIERNEACADRNYNRADALVKIIKDAGSRVLHINNEDILARKYMIRLRGIDAPEGSMPYGKEAKDELVKIIDGRSLKILIFGEDRYGRFVGDIYCNGIFVQEALLKKGLAWHYTAYDKRPDLEKVLAFPLVQSLFPLGISLFPLGIVQSKKRTVPSSIFFCWRFLLSVGRES